jgi:hypothetical protein
LLGKDEKLTWMPSCKASFLELKKQLTTTPVLVVGVFCKGKNKVVKITCSNSEMVLRYKAHYDLSWFRILLEGNSPMSSGLILKMNRGYNGVSRELEKVMWYREK